MLDREHTADTLSKDHIAVVLAVLLASALATELIGIHALFGAFVAGAIMPTDGDVPARCCASGSRRVSVVLLLPLFFAFTGLRTQVGLLDDAGELGGLPRHHRRGDRSASSAARSSPRAGPALAGARRPPSAR